MASPMDFNTLSSPLEVFDYHARNTPSATFLEEDLNISLSYLESCVLTRMLLPSRLLELCPDLLSSVRSSFKPRVILITPNNSMLLLTILALWRASCTAVLVPPRAESELWMGMISSSKPALIIAGSGIFQKVEQCVAEYNKTQGTNTRVISLEALIPLEFQPTSNSAVSRVSNFIPSCRQWIQASFPPGKVWLDSTAQDTPADMIAGDALVLFTSSAVDRNSIKSVTYTHRLLIQSSIRTILALGEDLDRFYRWPNRHLGWMPLSHCFEIGASFCGVVLASGGSYIFFDNTVSSPLLAASTSMSQQLLAALAFFGNISSFSAVPFIAQGIADSASSDDLSRLRRLRYFVVAGAPTPNPLFQWMADNHIAYVDGCGATEVLWIARRRALRPDETMRGLSICPGLMGVLRISSREDMSGELVIMGKSLPTSYDNIDNGAFSYDAETNVTTYRTGDLYRYTTDVPLSALIREDQSVPEYDADVAPLTGISYMGRVNDTVVLSNGEKIDALAIEQSLEANKLIDRAAVVADVHGNALLTFIQPKLLSNALVNWQMLINVALQHNVSLPFEKRIRRENIIFVQRLPTTAKNTLHRKRLRHIIASLRSNSEISFHLPPPDGAPAPGHHISPHFGVSATAALQLPQISTYEPNTRIHTQVTDNREEPFANGLYLSTVSEYMRNLAADILEHVFEVPSGYLRDRSMSLVDLPLTSLASVEVSKALGNAFSVKILPAEMYSMHTVDDVCFAIMRHQRERDALTLPQSFTQHSHTPSPRRRSQAVPAYVEDICITGAACRFSGGINCLEDFWAALIAPDAFLHSFSKATEEMRRPTSASTLGEPCKHPCLQDEAAGFSNVKSFASFFGIPPRDAEAMSLNTRLVLQMGYEAIEDAGLAPGSISGRRWGVFTSVNESGWRVRQSENSSSESFANNAVNFQDDAAAGRLAYYLNVNGPAIDLKTACSSSAVAIHQALLAIRNDDCDAAIIVAATTHVHPAGAAFRLNAGIASPSGRSLPFSQWADGYVPSEGTAAIVLQKYADAATEPYAIIRASSIVQDGTARGFLSPNPAAQKRLLKKALERAECGPDDICFLEAHGTGTALGDSIELSALQELFRRRRDVMYIGSCKAVIGHTEECSGLASVLKILLCFSHGTIPPQPFTGPLSEVLSLPDARLALSSQSIPLPPGSDRLIGISSFGLYGTLAHVILQEPPPLQKNFERKPPSNDGHVFVVSGATGEDLRAIARRYLRSFGRRHLRWDELPSLCLASRLTRDHHAIRRGLFVHDWRELFDELQTTALAHIPRTPTANPSVGLWFGIPLDATHKRSFKAPRSGPYLPGVERVDWPSRYAPFASQLMQARTLVHLGVSVTVVGGEGGGELVAGVMGGAIPPSAVFCEAEPAQDTAGFAIARCVQEVLEEHLVMFTAEEARLVGRHASDVFSLRGTHVGLASLAAVAELNITVRDDEEFLRACRVDMSAKFEAPTLPIFSAVTCDTLDSAMATSPAYWSRIQTAFADGKRAAEAMAKRCQIVVDLSSPVKEVYIPGHTVIAGEYIEEILCGLYEAGCNIDWRKYEATASVMERLPSYVWATSSGEPR